MEKNLERIREEYKNYSIDSVVATVELLRNYVSGAIDFSQKHFILANRRSQKDSGFGDNYSELQKRVHEGFCGDMNKVFGALDENKSQELFKLGFFTIQKFLTNTLNICSVGIHSVSSEDGTLVSSFDEDSLLTETFFAEKFKEITGHDLVDENRGKVYEKK